MPWARALQASSNVLKKQEPYNKQSNKAPFYLYVIVVVWLIFTVLAAIYFISDRLVKFDPEEKLLNISTQALVAEVISEFDLPAQMPNTLINFTSEGCKCNQNSQEHLSDVKNTAKKENLAVINISLPQNLSNIIPSTPSVLLLDNNSQLIYFGPYSEGASCNKGEGIIDLVMANYKKGFNAELIISNAQGCYCNVWKIVDNSRTYQQTYTTYKIKIIELG